jgi:hypothetical protein
MADKRKSRAKVKLRPKKKQTAKSGPAPTPAATQGDSSDDLSTRFTEAILREFALHGAEAMEDLRKKRPWVFLKFVQAMENRPSNISPEKEEPVSYDQIRADVLNDLRDLAHTGVNLHALVDEALACLASNQPA